MEFPIDKCPHCGGDYFFRKDYLSGVSHYLGSSTDNNVDNSGMYDSLRTKTGKYWYCNDCGKRLFKEDDVLY